ncbi:hypothetical protein QFC22_002023 [Naganishia vaughanmartiniae]|uniref:Uncharacterized protein n=1 Tax=Naganishia vaughanmartiniae TaxID=1424756 RepID=A0ACC2XGT0_9TREE|nr:hypothetical protein QFC22_002023 [Naganishia vaughanmartiniae]
MMAKLRKPRRPSDSQHRPAELTVRIPSNSSSTAHTGRGDQYTTSSLTTPVVAPWALDGLRDLPISQGDFRQSVIIDTLSKRFSVLRAKASPIRTTFAQTATTTSSSAGARDDPYLQQTGIDEIRLRLAAQRERQQERGTGRYIAPEEETLVLDELVSSFHNDDDDDESYSPIPRSTTYSYSQETGSLASGSRTYGFGSTTGMKEADVLRRAHHHAQNHASATTSTQRSVSDNNLPLTTAPAAGSIPNTSTSGTGNGTKDTRRISAMLLAGLPVVSQERIVDALLEIEEDLIAEERQHQQEREQEETILAPYYHQASETLLPSNDELQHASSTQQLKHETITTPQKQQQRPHHQRQSSSITRSPFTENLADIVMGREGAVGGSGSASHSRNGSAVSSIGKEAVGRSPPVPAQPVFTGLDGNVKPPTTSSRRSTPLSLLSSDINAHSDPGDTVFPLGALPPTPDSVGRQQHQHHVRTPSASAAVIPRRSLETGYVPGSARPFVGGGVGASSSSARNSGSPLEIVARKRKDDVSGLPQQQQLPQLVRKASTAVIPPNRPGPLTLKPLLMPGSATTIRGGAAGLPSVSPVVATFADSAGRKGWTGTGPFMPVSSNAIPIPMPDNQGYPTAGPSSLAVDYPAVQSGSPLDNSFDIDGYYGHDRSPVEPGMQYGSSPEERDGGNTTDPLRLVPRRERQGIPPQVLIVDRESHVSFDTQRSTSSPTRENQTSPNLMSLPNVVPPADARRSITSSTNLFDAEGGDDEEKQESFDDLQAMQERLMEAAQEVRRGLSAGMQGDGRAVSPGLVSFLFPFKSAYIDAPDCALLARSPVDQHEET